MRCIEEVVREARTRRANPALHLPRQYRADRPAGTVKALLHENHCLNVGKRLNVERPEEIYPYGASA